MSEHKKKVVQEEQGESAPLWIISFADLVTLMLSFFVILAAGNPKDAGNSAEFAKVMAAVRVAFGSMPDPAAAAADEAAMNFEDLVKKLKALAGRGKEYPKKRGYSDEEGLMGRSFRVRRLRDGAEITAGGPVFFEPFSAKLSAEGLSIMGQFAELLKGHRNVVEIRGHSDEESTPANWTYEDALKLSFERTQCVARELIARGIDSRALRLTAVGPNEPLKRFDASQREQNRRVEIIIRESLIDDYIPNPVADAEPTTAPAAQDQPAPSKH